MKTGSISALVALALWGCDTPGPSVPTASVPPVASSSEADPLPDPGVFKSKRFGLRLRLPDSSTWRLDDTRAPWLTASQPSAGSTLLVRLWRSENRMSRQKCEEQARGFRKLPTREGAEILSEQRVEIPPGFDTHADVGVTADSKGGLFGFILAFGGSGRRCFAYVYVTRAEGPTADTLVADRLAEMMEGSLKTLAFESDLDAILERDAAPPAPEGG